MPRLIPMARPQKIAVASPRSESKAERDRFYSGVRWMRLSKAYRRKNPLCERCKAAGLVVAAELVHHKAERLEDPRLAYRWSNLEALCNPCHSSHHKGRKLIWI